MLMDRQRPARCSYDAGAGSAFVACGPALYAEDTRSLFDGEGVPTFGGPQKSDAQMIVELLAKLPPSQPQPLQRLPQEVQTVWQGCGKEHSSSWAQTWRAHSMRQAGKALPPPGLEGLRADLSNIFSIESMSTTDETGSAHESMLSTEAATWAAEDGCHTFTSTATPHQAGVGPVLKTMVAGKAKQSGNRKGMTTLMVRNVPMLYTQDMLLQEMLQTVNYDFFYLPRSVAGPTNMTYAFINFLTEADAISFKDMWHKKRLQRFTACKPLNISFADVQGLRANVAQLKQKRVRCMQLRQCEPIVIIDGENVPLEQALAILKHEAATSEAGRAGA